MEQFFQRSNWNWLIDQARLSCIGFDFKNCRINDDFLCITDNMNSDIQHETAAIFFYLYLKHGIG